MEEVSLLIFLGFKESELSGDFGAVRKREEQRK